MKTHFHSYFLPAVLAGGVILSFFIFKPFLAPLILAVILAVVFYPLQRVVLRAIPKLPGVSALLTLVIIVSFILTPLTFLGVQIFQEVQQLYFSLVVAGEQGTTIEELSQGLTQSMHELVPASHSISIDLGQYLKTGLSWLFEHVGSIFSNVASAAVAFFILLIALYYLLRDGVHLRKLALNLTPLAQTDTEAVFAKLELAINSIIRGSITVAIIQGVVATVGFIIFGVPNPVLWGTLAAIMALVPSVGTSLVLIPAVIFLYLSGHPLSALGLLGWAMFAVGLIDNVLGPILVGRGARLHPLLVLLSVLGGLAFFGPIGFLLGPLTISFVLALFDVYASTKTA